MKKLEGPRVLFLDIETSPIIAHTWGIWGRDIGLNQIMQNWNIIAWAAKWLGDPASKMFYKDQRDAKDVHDDKVLLQGIWKLMDEADVIVAHNGDQFDIKRLNTRFVVNGYTPPASYRTIDTKKVAKRAFGFTSNRLVHLCDELKLENKKMKTKKFQGHDLWTECLKGNREAWEEMERYNRADVMALESLYMRLQAWDKNIDFNTLHDGEEYVCACGSREFHKNGLKRTIRGMFQRLRCNKCGAEYRARENLLPAAKRAKTLVRC